MPAAGQVAARERRRSPRFQCKGSVSITAESSQVRMWGTVTDISMRGSYVEMSSTLPVDSKVSLVLDISGIRIRAKGIVRISYPGLGMGVLLTEVLADQREFLDQLLATLAEANAVTTSEEHQEKAATETLAGVDTVVLVNELRRFFTGKSVLSREEFIRIAERCQQI
jgi:hypothetical protein